MRILLINFEYPPIGGGGGIAAQQLARGFVSNGHQVDIITSHYPGLGRRESDQGIQIYRVTAWTRPDLATASLFSMACFVFFGTIQGIKLCLRHKYQGINTHFVVPTGPVGLLLSRLFRIKNILSIHGGDVYDPSKKTSPHNYLLMRMLVRFILNRASTVVAQSNNTKSNADIYYLPRQTIKIIPLAYQVHEFKPKSRTDLNLEDDKRYLISVGRLISRKGYEHLIRSLAQTEPNTIALIIGDGPQRGPLQRLANRHQLEGRVRFLGHLPEERKFQYLSVSDIYVLSSTHEGFGIVLQEAMQVGLPIIASNNGGQTDLILDGVNGYLIPPARPDLIADRVRKLLSNENLRRSMGEKNRGCISKYSAKVIAGEYEKLF